MSRDRSDEPRTPAFDEPAGDETVAAAPKARKAKFLPSDSAVKTAIYQPEAHGERPETVPEGTDEIALSQPDVTDTEIQTGLTTDPKARARVLDVHDKAAKLLAELDATSNIKNPDKKIRRSPVPKTPVPDLATKPPPISARADSTIDASAPTEPITEEEDEPSLDEDAEDEGETVVNSRPVARPAYPTPGPGAVSRTPAPVQHTPAPGMVQHTPAPGMVQHTPAPGVVTAHPLAADEADDAIGIETIETGWSPNQPPPSPIDSLDPMAPRPMPPGPQRRSVGSVLLAPFRAIASLFKGPQPQTPPAAQDQGLPAIGEVGNLQTYTEVNRMVRRRQRAAPTSSPPPPRGPGAPDDGEG